MHHFIQPLQRDEVAEEDVRDDQRAKDVERMLAHTPSNFARRPRCGVEFAARGGITVDQALDAAVDMLQKNGVGAGPAAPDTAKESGDVKQRETESRDKKKAHPQVLHGQREAHEVKAAVQHIEKHRRKAVHRNPRQRDVNNEQQQRGETTGTREFSRHICRMQRLLAAILIDGAKRDEIQFVHVSGHHRTARDGRLSPACSWLAESCAPIASTIPPQPAKQLGGQPQQLEMTCVFQAVAAGRLKITLDNALFFEPS